MATGIPASRMGMGHYLGGQQSDFRIRLGFGIIVVVVSVVVVRLFFLMVMQHSFYTALAAGSHEVYSQLFPERGAVYIQDSRTGEEYPLAINRDVFTVFTDTRQIENQKQAEDVAWALAEEFGYDEERRLKVFYTLQKEDDPYEPIEQKVDQTVVDRLKEKNLPSIGFVRLSERFYPEGPLASHVVGFVGKDTEGKSIGRYGVEGYWEKELAGTGGFFAGLRGAGGGWIPVAGQSVQESEDGVDLLLTIDRTLQYQACNILAEGVKEYEAESGTLVILDPRTGAVRAMCTVPDFDPNTYNKVDDIAVYNNDAVFTPYEPGSIFKPFTVAAAINEEAMTPNTLYNDTGSIEAGCTKAIKNAGERSYGMQSLTGALENSINTAMVNTVVQIGKHKFRDYVEAFGFGVKEGIELDTEVSGTIESLSRNKSDKVDCYTATASFGQGITATPLQLVTGFATIANGGTFLRPYIVDQIRYANGRVSHERPREIAEVLSKRTASLVSGMLVSVIDSGQAGAAAVPGYYVAGKTGTAQISGEGGYTDETNHSFVGFAPVDNPVFVMIVKYEKPKRAYSSSTAAPTFGKIARFALQYYGVPPSR